MNDSSADHTAPPHRVIRDVRDDRDVDETPIHLDLGRNPGRQHGGANRGSDLSVRGADE
jgi:hypothetical protein